MGSFVFVYGSVCLILFVWEGYVCVWMCVWLWLGSLSFSLCVCVAVGVWACVVVSNRKRKTGKGREYRHLFPSETNWLWREGSEESAQVDGSRKTKVGCERQNPSPRGPREREWFVFPLEILLIEGQDYSGEPSRSVSHPAGVTLSPVVVARFLGVTSWYELEPGVKGRLKNPCDQFSFFLFAKSVHSRF